MLATNTLHSLPDVIHQAKEETVEGWADAVEHIHGTELEFGDKLDQHSVESINEMLTSIYSSKLSSTSTSD